MDIDEGAELPPTRSGAAPAMAVLDTLEDRLLEARIRRRMLGELEPAQVRVDRFVLERELGAGGMGTIYAGYDEELQRRVAIKFLRKFGDEAGDDRRLHREAQALAQLSHPNVVPIYDVGRHEGRIWLAMEYVPGQTLRAWAEDESRSRAELLERWLAAGRGLAAVHEAGLIHRDVKPDNVMLGEDGRVRVIDFGLVRALEGVSDSSSVGGLVTSEQWSTSLTIERGFVGTPAYAAPEQLEGRAVDPRSDQYSFCASIWEALCGQRPSRKLRERGGLVSLPEGVRLPRSLRRVLSRGLALDRRDRFADMPSLLAALEPSRPRWIAPIGVAALVGVAVLGTAWTLRSEPPSPSAPTDPCVEAGAPIDRLWTSEGRARLEAGLPRASAAQTLETLDGWTEDWRAVARRSCEDVHVHHRLSEDSLDHRGVCLDRRLAEFSALAGTAEAGLLDSGHAVIEALGLLESPSVCLSESVLASELGAPPTEHAEAIAALRQQLLRVGSGLDDRRVAARLRAVAELDARATELGWRPLLAEIAVVRGRLHVLAGDATAAREQLGRAIDLADVIADLDLEAKAWSLINELERTIEFDHERAEWAWAREAAVFAEHPASDRQRAQLLVDRGLGQASAGRRAEAELSLREAIALLEDGGPLAAWERASALRALAYLTTDSDAEGSLALLAEARSLELGLPDSAVEASAPLDADDLLNEGIAQFIDGDHREAEATMDRALATAIAELGPRSEQVARTHTVFAAIYEELGDAEKLREHAQLADEISLAAVGPTHPMRADVLSAVGKVALDEGRLDAAIDAYERARSIASMLEPRNELAVALAEVNLADALRRADRTPKARSLIDHARPVLERELPTDHPSMTHLRAVSEGIDP